MKRDDRDSFSEDEIKNLIREALKVNIEDKKAAVSKLKIDTALISTVKEFLNTFAIIGYDLSGEPVVLKYAKSQMEKDALNTIIMKYLTYVMYEG
jgi:hypothetical protein